MKKETLQLINRSILILRKYFGKVCDVKMKSLENMDMFMKILLSQEDVHTNGLRTNCIVKSARKSSNKEKSRPDDFGLFFSTLLKN